MRLAVTIVLLTVASTFLFCGCKPQDSTPPPPVEEKLTPEESLMRRQANALGTKLYAEAQKVEQQTNLTEAEVHKALKPVYADIEQFVFSRMSAYSNRISSITITYSRPSLQCVIYVKKGDEEELLRLKRNVDSIVGRVVENLPIVRYLMIKTEQ